MPERNLTLTTNPISYPPRPARSSKSPRAPGARTPRLRGLGSRRRKRRKGDVTGCQFGGLGACPVVSGGCTHPTGWWGRPNHRQLSRDVLGTRDPTTARDIRCLHGERKARGRSPPRHHYAPAPRPTTHWARLARRAVLQAAPRTPGFASRKLIYSDPDLKPLFATTIFLGGTWWW
jgi:hypothetical protein